MGVPGVLVSGFVDALRRCGGQCVFLLMVAHINLVPYVKFHLPELFRLCLLWVLAVTDRPLSLMPDDARHSRFPLAEQRALEPLPQSPSSLLQPSELHQPS